MDGAFSVFVLFWSVFSAFLLHRQGFRLRGRGPTGTDPLRFFRLLVLVCTLAWISRATVNQIDVVTLRGGAVPAGAVEEMEPPEDAYSNVQLKVRFREYGEEALFTLGEIKEMTAKSNATVRMHGYEAGMFLEDILDLLNEADSRRQQVFIYDEYDNLRPASELLPGWVSRLALIRKLELDDAGMPIWEPDQPETVKLKLKTGKTLTMYASEYEDLKSFMELEAAGFLVMDNGETRNMNFREITDMFESGGIHVLDPHGPDKSNFVPLTLLQLKQLSYDHPEVRVSGSWVPASSRVLRYAAILSGSTDVPGFIYFKDKENEKKQARRIKVDKTTMKPNSSELDGKPAYMLEIAHVGGYCFNGTLPNCVGLCRSEYLEAQTDWTLKGVRPLDLVELVEFDDQQKESHFEFLKSRETGRYWLAKFWTHSLGLSEDSSALSLPDAINAGFLFRHDLVANIEQFLILSVKLYEQVDFEGKMASSGIKASRATKVPQETLVAAINEFHPKKPFLACRYQSLNSEEERPTILHTVGLCFTRRLKPIDCPEQGRFTCVEEQLRIVPVDSEGSENDHQENEPPEHNDS